jgi:AcrR family transcriptional regulator
MYSVAGFAGERSYGGISAEQRRAKRRAALLKAGRELWVEQGWAAVTMRGVCARAKIIDRYFYENFNDRDALLVAVAEEVRDETFAFVLSTFTPHLTDIPPLDRLRAALKAVVEFIAENPGDAQILFGDHGGSGVLEKLRRDIIGNGIDLFVALFGHYLVQTVSATEFRVTLLVGIGGFVETVTAWRSGAIDATADDLVEMLMRLAQRLSSDLIEFQ